MAGRLATEVQEAGSSVRMAAKGPAGMQAVGSRTGSQPRIASLTPRRVERAQAHSEHKVNNGTHFSGTPASSANTSRPKLRGKRSP